MHEDLMLMAAYYMFISVKSSKIRGGHFFNMQGMFFWHVYEMHFPHKDKFKSKDNRKYSN